MRMVRPVELDVIIRVTEPTNERLGTADSGQTPKPPAGAVITPKTSDKGENHDASNPK